MPAGNRAPAPLRWIFFLALIALISGLVVHAAWFWFVEQERARASASWPAVDGVFERRSVPGALDSRRHAAYTYAVARACERVRAVGREYAHTLYQGGGTATSSPAGCT